MLPLGADEVWRSWGSWTLSGNRSVEVVWLNIDVPQTHLNYRPWWVGRCRLLSNLLPHHPT